MGGNKREGETSIMTGVSIITLTFDPSPIKGEGTKIFVGDKP
jgi:hypothetical protein